MPELDIKRIKSVYCVGLGGVGVSAIAKYFLSRGVKVSGSDPVQSPLIDDVVKLGGRYLDRPRAENIDRRIDLLVYSDACPPEHPEIAAARQQRLPIASFAEALALIMSPYRQRLAICGTNGKSTTTALTALLWLGSGSDPTVFVGSRVSSFDGNFHLGKDRTFIAEADEYRDHFHELDPTSLTITNIETDHLDFFKDLTSIIGSFTKMIRKLPATGKLIVNSDDKNMLTAVLDHPQRMSFGFNPNADVRIVEYRTRSGVQEFSLVTPQGKIGPYQLHRPGVFNVLNATAALATALANDLPTAAYATVIKEFPGIWRRFEIINPGATVTVINDYAHHPSAIRGTLEGARKYFPGRRIVAVFQPHHQNRMNTMFTEFSRSFAAADYTVITEVYNVLGREERRRHNSRELVERLRQDGQLADYLADPQDVLAQLMTQLRSGDVVILMSAGDLWTVAAPLAAKYE